MDTAESTGPACRAAAAVYPENIVLIGMMGAGKTSVGRLLAQRLGKTFLDCDHELEARCGVKITTIFEVEGEEGFRDRESATLAGLLEQHGVVLATGGGAVLREQNRRLLRAHGFVVYLRSTLHELWQRTRHDRTRPLLATADPRARLAELIEQRGPLYLETAHLVMDSGAQNVKTLVGQLEAKIAEACRGREGAPPGSDREPA